MKLCFRILILHCLLLSNNVLIGQKLNDAQWFLYGTIHFDFRENELLLDLIPSFPGKKSPGEYSTSMNSDIGELLFYSGGCEIINANHVFMMNGDSLNPGARELGYCKSGSSIWDQCVT